MKKRIVSMLLAVVAVFALLPVMGAKAEAAGTEPLKLISQNFQLDKQYHNNASMSQASKNNVYNIMDFLKAENPDIIVMQECCKEGIQHIKEYRDEKANNYDIKYCFFEGVRLYTNHDGKEKKYYASDDSASIHANPIIYNKSTLRFLGEEHIWYTEDGKKGECFGDGFPWYRGITVAKFRVIDQDKADYGKVFYVFATHFPLVSYHIEGNKVIDVNGKARQCTYRDSNGEVITRDYIVSDTTVADPLRNGRLNYFDLGKSDTHQRIWGLRGDDKAENYNQIMCAKKLKEVILEKCGINIPYFVMGDFNVQRSDVSYKELTNATYVYDMATLAEENGKTNDYTKTTCGQKIYDYCFGNEELSDVKSYKVLNTINEGHSDHNGICFEVVLGKPAKINMSPTPASVKQGATATFAVNAENVKKFQWQYYSSANGVWKNVGASIYSAKTAVLKFTGEAKYNGWYYRCAVTGWDGDIEYSNPAKLTVLLSAKINAQPKAASVKQNAKATFTVKADNAENYQWQYSKNGTTWRNTGDSIPNTATLSFTALAKYNGYYYRCAVTGQDGAVKYSGKAKLTVKK